MKKSSLLFSLLGLLAIVSVPSGSASAQATRTFVSGVGNDADPCSRTAPCRTFAGAITKTAANGEINCLDPGGFGAVSITKSITIDCTGVSGGILAALVNGVIVNAGASDKVVLRNLIIQGAGNGLDGIRFIAGLELELDNVRIEGFTGDGIDVAKSAQGILEVRNSVISQVPIGIKLSTSASNVTASISNTSFNNLSGTGVQANANSFANISDSVFSTIGGAAMAANAATATVNARSNVISNSNIGMHAVVSGAKINATNNTFFGNSSAFTAVAGAAFLSGNDNKVDINPGSASTGFLTTK